MLAYKPLMYLDLLCYSTTALHNVVYLSVIVDTLIILACNTTHETTKSIRLWARVRETRD